MGSSLHLWGRARLRSNAIIDFPIISLKLSPDSILNWTFFLLKCEALTQQSPCYTLKKLDVFSNGMYRIQDLCSIVAKLAVLQSRALWFPNPVDPWDSTFNLHLYTVDSRILIFHLFLLHLHLLFPVYKVQNIRQNLAAYRAPCCDPFLESKPLFNNSAKFIWTGHSVILLTSYCDRFCCCQLPPML